MDKIQELKDIVQDESLSTEERQAAAGLLAQLEPKPKPFSFTELFEEISQRAAQARERENAQYKVCPSCYRKQTKDRETCELCGKTPERWEPAISDNHERCKWIAAATSFTPDELNDYIARSSMDVAFAKHCALILELRGIPRVKSYWEKAGLDFDGHKRSDAG